MTVKAGLSSTGSAPTGAGAAIVIPFTIDSAGTYNFVARVNCPSADDDSYWIKIDNGAYVMANGLTSSGWQWSNLTNAALSAGQHTITIAYREDGAKLDKLLITTSGALVSGLGGTAFNCGNLPPAVSPSQSFTINDRVDNGAVVGTVTGSDLEGANLQDWQITGGTGADAFAINASSGEITVANRSLIDFDNQQSYTLNVSVSDGTDRSASETVTINLTRTPVITPSQTFLIDKWVTDGMVVGTALATDKDPNTTLQDWKITGGSGAAYFAVDAATGEIKAINSAVLNSGNANKYSITLTVSDGANTSKEEAVTINISDKVYVCHDGKTLQIGRSGAQDHLNHGDKNGACEQAANTSAMASRNPDVVATESLGSSIQVYPNPVRDAININLSANPHRINTIQVVDMSGKVYKQVQVTQGGRIVIQRDHLKPGIYMLRMQGDRNVNHKIVVQ